MRLNKSTSHAIRILIECARGGGALVKVAHLAASLDLTMQNVFKIVHILSRAGLVAATRGRNGGVRLARAPADIRIGDIVRAMESTDIELDVDGDRKAARGAAVVGVNRVLDDALEAFVAVLDSHSLADMLGGGAKIGQPAPPTGTPKRRKSSQVREASISTPIRTSLRSGGN